jgi:hypothetical protein
MFVYSSKIQKVLQRFSSNFDKMYSSLPKVFLPSLLASNIPATARKQILEQIHTTYYVAILE